MLSYCCIACQLILSSTHCVIETHKMTIDITQRKLSSYWCVRLYVYFILLWSCAMTIVIDIISGKICLFRSTVYEHLYYDPCTAAWFPSYGSIIFWDKHSLRNISLESDICLESIIFTLFVCYKRVDCMIKWLDTLYFALEENSIHIRCGSIILNITSVK